MESERLRAELKAANYSLTDRALAEIERLTRELDAANKRVTEAQEERCIALANSLGFQEQRDEMRRKAGVWLNATADASLRADAAEAALATAREELVKAREIQRWNIEKDGSDLLICDGNHDKGEKCDYVRYCPASERDAMRAALQVGVALERENCAKKLESLGAHGEAAAIRARARNKGGE